jgi:hypothetical protein
MTASQTSARVAAMLSCPDCTGDGCPACTGEPGEPTIRPLTPARDIQTGRFSSPDSFAAVRQVALPGGKTGWQCGRMIFADRAPARRVALRRAAKATLMAAAIEAAYERSMELNYN